MHVSGKVLPSFPFYYDVFPAVGVENEKFTPKYILAGSMIS